MMFKLPCSEFRLREICRFLTQFDVMNNSRRVMKNSRAQLR